MRGQAQAQRQQALLARLARVRTGAICAATVLALSACSNLSSLRDAAPAPTDFSGSLATEYLGFAESEHEQHRWRSADYFAGKGMMALRGAAPAPENPARLSLSAENMRVLMDARERLVGHLSSRAVEATPEPLARAQLLFDCWVKQVADDHEDVSAASCGTEFDAGMEALERAMLQAGIHHQLAAEREVMSAHLVFSPGQMHINGRIRKQLAPIVKASRTVKEPRIRVVGFADAVGSEEKNQRLALKRAEQVRETLIALGVDRKQIVARGGGIASPVEIGETSLPERRVDVVLYDLAREK